MISAGPIVAQGAAQLTDAPGLSGTAGYWRPSMPAYRPGDPLLTGVIDRVRPEYDAQGIRRSGFIWYPSLLTTGAYNDNIYGLRQNSVSDFITRVAPQLRVKSDWSRHVFEAYGLAEGVWYARNSGDDQFNGQAGLNGAVDASRDLRFRYFGNVSRTHEDRSVTGLTLAGGPQLLDEPVRATTGSGGVGIERRFNRFRFDASTNYARNEYADARISGRVVDQTYRNTDIIGTRVRLGYDISPKSYLFVEGGYERRDQKLDVFDNDTYRAVGGFAGELTRLIHGEVYGGYLSRNYDGRTVRDVEAFTYGGALTWYASQLLTLAVFGERGINETRFGGDGTFVQSQLGLRADYELRRNLILTGRTGFEWNDYKHTDRTDVVRVAGLSLTYLVNRNVHMSLDYRRTDKMSSIDAFEYERNYIGGTVRLQY